jgi:hypothetical protein
MRAGRRDKSAVKSDLARAGSSAPGTVFAQSRAVRIVVLADNTTRTRGLLGEHGLSLRIERAGRRVVFDTGQGLALGHTRRPSACCSPTSTRSC